MPPVRSLLAAGLLTSIAAGPAGAINMVIDYTYDTQGFFNPATTNGALARATIEKAAADFSAILTDSFTPIVTPPDYVSDADGQAPPVLYTWDWSIEFSNPGVNGGPTVVINEPTFAADEYRIYAGGRSLGGSTLGVGGPGGASYSAGGSWYFASERAEIDAITAAFEVQRNRGQAAGDFARWGGAITFDTDASTTWNYDWMADPVAGQSDLYSVALHELAHAVGWGTSDEWNTLAVGGFSGAASVAEFGGVVPVNGGHWLDGTMSTVLRDGETQETALDPNLTNGTRKLLTDLDAAALDDIGWDINQAFSYSAVLVPGDTDGDGDVDDTDLGIAISNFTGPGGSGKTLAQGDTDADGDVDDTDLGVAISGFTGPLTPVPEPGSVALLGLGAVFAIRRRRA